MVCYTIQNRSRLVIAFVLALCVVPGEPSVFAQDNVYSPPSRSTETPENSSTAEESTPSNGPPEIRKAVPVVEEPAPSAAATPEKKPEAKEEKDRTIIKLPKFPFGSKKPEKKEEQEAPTEGPQAGTTADGKKKIDLQVTSIDPNEIAEFSTCPPEIQKLISEALALTKMNLTYKFGGADPAQGGMDCSGTIFYLLKQQGIKPPRQSNHFYKWTWEGGEFFAVNAHTQESFEFAHLRPGDLLFWTGTYKVDRDPPVTHVMLYLGTERKTGKRIMFGASSGRTYDGNKQNGISVFDFYMPSPKSKSRFIGYGRIPGLGDDKEVAQR